MKPEGEQGVKKLLKTKAVRCMYCMLYLGGGASSTTVLHRQIGALDIHNEETKPIAIQIPRRAHTKGMLANNHNKNKLTSTTGPIFGAVLNSPMPNIFSLQCSKINAEINTQSVPGVLQRIKPRKPENKSIAVETQCKAPTNSNWKK